MQTPAMPRPATAHVEAAQRAFAETLPEDDRKDFENASRGLVEALPDAVYMNGSGKIAWSMKPYAFLDGDCPPEVNPSLWRQAQLNAIHGLFEVCGGVYQVRSIDLANMTIVEGETGIILIDTLSTQEGARAALDLYRRNRGDRPVTGVIITHSHTDHWGGCLGAASRDDYASGRVPLVVPEGFLHHAVSENVIAGDAMRRRALYQFGGAIPPGPKGHVDNGLGKAMARGRPGLVAPNDEIRETGETRVIDGVTFEFQMAPDTEAPAEMHIYMPDRKVLNLAENAVHNFHNLLPFRGAQVRNTLNWTTYISEALELWGDKAEVLVGQHHWPVWGNAELRAYLEVQRDLYRFVHDQTVRLLNAGLTPQEIAEEIRLPKSIEDNWHVRGYYGSLRHNVKAIYQFYLGWYDCVPANLDPLPPVETGRRMIAYMGGIDAAVDKARADFEAGEYRWVAQVMHHAVFSDPSHAGARNLLADAYEQLGYMAECATWRNSYLFGAQELRNGMHPIPGRRLSAETLASMSTSQALDLMATRLVPERAEGHSFDIELSFTDIGETHTATLRNCALSHVPAARASATTSARLTRAELDALILNEATLPDLVATGRITLTGDAAALETLFSAIEEPAGNFPIVEP